MSATLATITPYLKEVYVGRIREQLNNKTILLKRIETSKDGITSNIGGKYVTFPIHTRRNSGVGARLENEALPPAGQQGTAAAQISLAYLYGRVGLSGQTIELSDSDPQAFAKALNFEMTGLKNDLLVDYNRQLYGDGSGTVATVKSVVTSNTIPVTDARYFQLNMAVDLVTLPSTVVQSNRTVTGIDLTSGANTVTVSGATITSVVGQVFTRFGSAAREITGLAKIISNSGVLYNVDPSTEPVWKSELDTNGGTARSLSEGLMTYMNDRITTNGGDVTLIIQSLGTRRAYANLLQQQRQFVNTQEFTGGFRGLAFTTDGGDIPVIADKDAPLNTQLFINEPSLTLYQAADWDWMDRDGSIWQRKIDASGTYDNYEATLFKYAQLGIDQRNTFGAIQNIIEAS